MRCRVWYGHLCRTRVLMRVSCGVCFHFVHISRWCGRITFSNFLFITLRLNMSVDLQPFRICALTAIGILMKEDSNVKNAEAKNSMRETMLQNSHLNQMFTCLFIIILHNTPIPAIIQFPIHTNTFVDHTFWAISMKPKHISKEQNRTRKN